MISQKSKYALRALLALARIAPGETMRIAAIAARETIPKKFLEQILLELKRAGFVASRRGKHGGYLLLRSPEEIVFGDVLRLMEGPFVPLGCLSRGGHRPCTDCRDRRLCAVRRVFARVVAASDEILDGTTLSDLLSDPMGGLAGEPEEWSGAMRPISLVKM
ncbi:Rrf2 family transcriptional regulator [Shinella sp. CPCC 101442]|uniref:RrF2 family transcriptional regulator n=1 Tax=Shinella sp. CPCC 101442 TaxID=2932265 RepID=UPI002152FC0E|nr:Rrf2 family transcriptional regulator [Shinella sp. CPCC 101442]MCR6499359.1 Rrf2 family transcriptional regulator [Shinella sp. CPCC 101442]